MRYANELKVEAAKHLSDKIEKATRDQCHKSFFTLTDGSAIHYCKMYVIDLKVDPKVH